jgi:septum site-determining protein MinC
MSKTQVRSLVEIKIATVVAVAIILRETDLSAIDAAMQELTGGEHDYFDDEFAVLDVGFFDLVDQAIDWSALIALLKSYRLNPVAVRNARPEMQQAILAHGLSLDGGAKPRPLPETTSAPESEPEPAQELAPGSTLEPAPELSPSPVAVAAESTPMAPVKPGSMIVDTPVRAGQRIYARGCDLVVTAAVNNGAEIIADGSIHIYAPLRGRALAGASGDVGARIFAMSMEAELVSIAGTYRTFDEGLPKDLARQAVQVSLDGDRIDLRAMTASSRS